MYRKSIISKRLEAKRKRCALMRAAKAENRMAAPTSEWTRFEHLLKFAVSQDGRHVSLQVGDKWVRCGSERTIRALLAMAIWRKREANDG